jgi:hypothetical protein
MGQASNASAAHITRNRGIGCLLPFCCSMVSLCSYDANGRPTPGMRGKYMQKWRSAGGVGGGTVPEWNERCRDETRWLAVTRSGGQHAPPLAGPTPHGWAATTCTGTPSAVSPGGWVLSDSAPVRPGRVSLAVPDARPPSPSRYCRVGVPPAVAPCGPSARMPEVLAGISQGGWLRVTTNCACAYMPGSSVASRLSRCSSVSPASPPSCRPSAGPCQRQLVRRAGGGAVMPSPARSLILSPPTSESGGPSLGHCAGRCGPSTRSPL